MVTRNLRTSLPPLQRGTPVGSSDAIRIAHMRHIQKQRTRENFLFGTATWAEVETGGEATPKAEAASPEIEVDSGNPASETPKGRAWRTEEEGTATATAPAPSPIAASASSSSLLSRIVRPRIRLPAITSTTQ